MLPQREALPIRPLFNDPTFVSSIQTMFHKQNFKKMTQFNVPTRDEVSPNNQAIFDNLKSAIGFVPNLYATIAYSEHGLGNYLQLQNGKTSLSKKEKELVNLVDVVIAIADKVVMNYLHNITQIPIDFPVAPELELALA